MKKVEFNYELIKQIARNKKIVLKTIYDKMGISRQHFDHVLKTGSLSAVKIAIICEILDCTPNDFFTINEDFELK
jgi:DNA-binding Xre family transcriptional regulator